MMKFFLSLLTIWIWMNSSTAQVWLVDPLEAIYPDENQLDKYSNSWECDFAQDAVIDVHVLVKLEPGNTFTLSATLDGKQLGVNAWSQLIDVPVEQNTGLDSRTEQYIGEVNPFVIRRAPFRIFEVIKPLKTDKFTSITEYSAFRFSIPSASLLSPGQHKVKILIHSDGFERVGNFIFRIHPVQLPKVIDSDFFYTNWFNLSKMEMHHQLERWTEPWYVMLDKYAEIMAHGRQNSISLPPELFQLEGDEIKLKDTLMLRFIDVFRKYGFKYFEAPHLLNRGENDDWGDPELKVALTKRRYYSENGKEDIRKLMTLIEEFATKAGLENQWLQHISDEPTAVNAACYRDASKQIKEIFPNVKIMEATSDRDSLTGAIDIWCPLINDFQENEDFFRNREKLGEKVLVYTCLIPGGKWLNRTLDMEKLRQVYFGWGAAYYNTGGYLHWGLNQYYADPFNQSVVKHPSPAASSNNYLPAGDTHIIYPGVDGPLSSVRFEAHRMGCEDFDLLQVLKKQNHELYERLVQTLFKDYTNYNLNIGDYRRIKKKLLESIN